MESDERQPGRETFLEEAETLALAGSSDLFLRARTPEFRKVTLALVAAGFSTYALLYCVQPLLPVFSQALKVSPSVSSLSLSVTTAALAGAMLVAGRVSDVSGRKPIMAISLFAVGLLTVACSFAPSWTTLLAIRGLTGVALAGVPAVAMAYLAEEVHPRDLGGAMGLYIAGNAYGGMAGRVLTGFLIDATGSWRVSIGVIGGFGIAAAALFVALLPPSRRFAPEAGVSIGHLGRAFARHLRDPGLAQLFLVGFLLMGGFVTTYNYLGYRLIEPPFDLSQAFAGSIFLVYLLGGPASAWFGRLGGRYGRGRMMVAAMALMLAGLCLTATPSLVVSIAAIAILDLGLLRRPRDRQWLGEPPRREGSGGGGLALPVRLLRRLQPVRLARRPVLVAPRLARHHGAGGRAHPRRPRVGVALGRARGARASATAMMSTRRDREVQREPENDQGQDQDQRAGGHETCRHRAPAGRLRPSDGRQTRTGALDVGTSAGQRRLGEMAIGGEPPRRALAENVGDEFLVVRHAPLGRLEGAQPVELVLLVDRVRDQSGDVGVVLDETAKDAVAIRRLARRRGHVSGRQPRPLVGRFDERVVFHVHPHRRSGRASV